MKTIATIGMRVAIVQSLLDNSVCKNVNRSVAARQFHCCRCRRQDGSCAARNRRDRAESPSTEICPSRVEASIVRFASGVNRARIEPSSVCSVRVAGNAQAVGFDASVARRAGNDATATCSSVRWPSLDSIARRSPCTFVALRYPSSLCASTEPCRSVSVTCPSSE